MLYADADRLDGAIDALLYADERVRGRTGVLVPPARTPQAVKRQLAEMLVKQALAVLHGSPYGLIERQGVADLKGFGS